MRKVLSDKTNAPKKAANTKKSLNFEPSNCESLSFEQNKGLMKNPSSLSSQTQATEKPHTEYSKTAFNETEFRDTFAKNVNHERMPTEGTDSLFSHSHSISKTMINTDYSHNVESIHSNYDVNTCLAESSQIDSKSLHANKQYDKKPTHALNRSLPPSDKNTVLFYLNHFYESTSDYNLKYDLGKCIETVRGVENVQIQELHSVIEELVGEKERLERQNEELVAENEYLRAKQS